MEKKLYRDEYHKMIGGVCAGLAEYFQMDVTIVRILFVITACGGVGFIPYIILWIVIPRKTYDFRSFNSPNVDYTVPPQQPGSQFSTPPPAGGNPFGGISPACSFFRIFSDSSRSWDSELAFV